MVLLSTLDQLAHTIHVLKQLQRLLTISASLSDLGDLLACIEAEYGSEIRLEDVIQHLEGEHLAVQLGQRRASRRASQDSRARVEAIA